MGRFVQKSGSTIKVKSLFALWLPSHIIFLSLCQHKVRTKRKSRHLFFILYCILQNKIAYAIMLFEFDCFHFENSCLFISHTSNMIHEQKPRQIATAGDFLCPNDDVKGAPLHGCAFVSLRYSFMLIYSLQH